MYASPDAAIEALARTQHGAFSRAQAVDVGMSVEQIKRRLRSDRWRWVAPTVYVLPGWDATYRQRVMVACLHGGPGAFASHRCAALLRGADGIKRAPVIVTVPRRLRRIPDVVVHYSTDCVVYDWSPVDAIPTATATRLLLDLARKESVTTLERVFEWGVRSGETSYLEVETLVDRIARRGRPGVQRTRQLLATVVRDGKRNGSEAETRFFQLLRGAGLPLPTRQRMVCRDDGTFAFCDYAYDGVDAVIEILGYEWHSSKRSLRADAERNNDLNLLGKTLIEFTWHHLTHDRAYVVNTVRKLLRDTRVEYRPQDAQVRINRLETRGSRSRNGS